MNKHRASVLMRHEVGLHARPSVKLTKLAKAFDSKIDLGLSPDGPWIDAKSIVKVMATKAPKDSTIYFRADGEVANKAWVAAIDPEIATYDQADDPYFRARASDLRDLRDRVLRRLAGEVDQAVPPGVIVAAEDMPPSLFLATDWRKGGLALR